MNAGKFGRRYDAEFSRMTRSYGFGEIALFRAMMKCLRLASLKGFVEEYHGNSRQVLFDGDGINSRIQARCELSDLLIVVYSPQLQTARFTFLQAKSERATLMHPVSHDFHGNLEQWDLLSRRPHVEGVGKFYPPQDLLSSALVDSIGSFGFFYKDPKRGFQVLYASADCLAPVRPHPVRYGKLRLNAITSTIRKTNGYDERMFTKRNFGFAHELYDLRIGEPLIIRGQFSSHPAAQWLAGEIKLLAATEQGRDQGRDLLLGLSEAIGEADVPLGSGSFGAKHMIIIGSKSDQKIPFNPKARPLGTSLD